MLAAALAQAPLSAEACGGFFCSAAQPVNQAAERILFSQNGDGTVTAVIQIQYEGPSESFSWLLPIASVPGEGDLAVASDLAFQRLQAATNPLYSLQTVVRGRCRERRGSIFAFGASDDSESAAFDSAPNAAPTAPSVIVAASGLVGPFEWKALAFDPNLEDPASVAVTWLTDNGYDVSPGSEDLMRPYLLEGRYLLALRLTKEASTGSIRPIVLTYPGDQPDIPLKLTAVAATEDMGVMAWVTGASRAVPMNYLSLEVNEARVDWFTGAGNYRDLVSAAADEAGGHGFVTEYAQRSNNLTGAIWSTFEETQWSAFRSRTFRNHRDLLDQSLATFGSLDGFGDALRAALVPPVGASFEDVRACPGCYDFELPASALFDSMETLVIEPMRLVQRLVDRQAYVTRLYSTLSAPEMTEDPVFTFNPDLGDVSNVHQATRVIECNDDVYEEDANWHIELPSGGVIRGTAGSVGSWPVATATQPANARVWQLGSSGGGVALQDNTDGIEQSLSAYNSTVPDPPRAGFCALVPGARPSPWTALVTGAGLSAFWARRRSRRGPGGASTR